MAPRKSVFYEVGLFEEETTLRQGRPQTVRFRSRDEVHIVARFEDHKESKEDLRTEELDRHARPNRLRSSGPQYSRMYRFVFALVLLATMISLLQSLGYARHISAVPIPGVSGGPVPVEPISERRSGSQKRGISSTKWCFRWAQQSAIVNGTLYLYGGELTTEQGQTQNNWTNNFITLDLTKTWNTGSPTLKGLEAPSGVPEVALGYLWNSHNSLFLYGGEFSWQPAVSPVPFATWEYNILQDKWIEYSRPVTSSGLSAPDDNTPVQRAAEGAGVTVPSLGRGFYFGGHEDGYTTPGWEQWIPRVYLQSLLEYTFPGYTNPDVDSLKGGQPAGSEGVYRNITLGGIEDDGFTKRADGLLIFVPGFGAQGILIALAGGTNESFTEMNTINIYDIAKSSWYTQATSGAYPKVRVNPCAVVAAAQDGSSYNIYMFGGQNLIPYDQQTQYHDLWILTLPSFQWIEVDQSGQSVPAGRSGATCNIWDGQMVMVGGYVGPTYSCEWPGTFVFDLSSCQWSASFTASKSSVKDNFLNQQPNQLYIDADNPGGLSGSYGYTVPQVVVDKIGGDKYGGATVTKPITAAPGGPMKTGSPIIYSTVYTTTGANGHVVTETGTAVLNTAPGSSGSSDSKIAAIVVGVVCGLAFILICYLLFCLLVYKKQLAVYKRHVEMAQAQMRYEKPAGLWPDQQQAAAILSPAESGSQAGSGRPSQGQTSSANDGTQSGRRSGSQDSAEDLLTGHEPTFFGVMLHPRRSLKVVNRD